MITNENNVIDNYSGFDLSGKTHSHHHRSTITINQGNLVPARELSQDLAMLGRSVRRTEMIGTRINSEMKPNAVLLVKIGNL